jgi:predicted Zn-dependent peptidase
VPAPSAGAATLLQVGANVTRDQIRFAWVTPAHGQPGDLALDLAAALLVDRGAGWLESALYRSPRLASSVSARQRSMALASVFEIEVTVSDGREVKEVLMAIRDALARFEGHITDEEIRRARRIWENLKLFGLDSSGGFASSLVTFASLGALPAPFDGGVSRYRAVSRDAVRSAVARYLGMRPWVVAIAHADPRRPLAGVVLDRTPVSW